MLKTYRYSADSDIIQGMIEEEKVTITMKIHPLTECMYSCRVPFGDREVGVYGAYLRGEMLKSNREKIERVLSQVSSRVPLEMSVRELELMLLLQAGITEHSELAEVLSVDVDQVVECKGEIYRKVGIRDSLYEADRQRLLIQYGVELELLPPHPFAELVDRIEQLIQSSSEDPEYMVKAVSSIWSRNISQINRALKCVTMGLSFKLSKRQFEVLFLFRVGIRNYKYIASIIGIAESTVKTHAGILFSKLGFGSGLGEFKQDRAVLKAIECGVLPPIRPVLNEKD